MTEEHTLSQMIKKQIDSLKKFELGRKALPFVLFFIIITIIIIVWVIMVYYPSIGVV